MDKGIIIDVFIDAIKMILTLSAPMLITALTVGLMVAVFQATTQIQEQTLAFVPKVASILIVLLLSFNWITSSLIEFTIRIFNLIDQIML